MGLGKHASAPNLQFFGDGRRDDAADPRPDDANQGAWAHRVHFVVNHGGVALPVASTNDATNGDTTRRHSAFFACAPAISVLLDVSPYQILDTMALAKVDLIFRTLKVNHAHVTCSGLLAGIVTRQRLRDVLRAEQPQKRIQDPLPWFCRP